MNPKSDGRPTGWRFRQEFYLGDFPDGPVAKDSVLPMQGAPMSPGQGTRSHMLQLKVSCAAVKISEDPVNTAKPHSASNK